MPAAAHEGVPRQSDVSFKPALLEVMRELVMEHGDPKGNHEFQEALNMQLGTAMGLLREEAGRAAQAAQQPPAAARTMRSIPLQQNLEPSGADIAGVPPTRPPAAPAELPDDDDDEVEYLEPGLLFPPDHVGANVTSRILSPGQSFALRLGGDDGELSILNLTEQPDGSPRILPVTGTIARLTPIVPGSDEQVADYTGKRQPRRLPSIYVMNAAGMRHGDFRDIVRQEVVNSHEGEDFDMLPTKIAETQTDLDSMPHTIVMGDEEFVRSAEVNPSSFILFAGNEELGTTAYMHVHRNPETQDEYLQADDALDDVYKPGLLAVRTTLLKGLDEGGILEFYIPDLAPKGLLSTGSSWPQLEVIVAGNLQAKSDLDPTEIEMLDGYASRFLPSDSDIALGLKEAAMASREAEIRERVRRELEAEMQSGAIQPPENTGQQRILERNARRKVEHDLATEPSATEPPEVATSKEFGRIERIPTPERGRRKLRGNKKSPTSQLYS